MTPQNPRGPQSSQPEEPGWWQASDGLWYPPESAPGASPVPPPAPESVPPVAEPAPSPAAPPMAAATAPAPAAVPVKQSNGLALTSLLFGILGFCLCALGGIVAIITGFIALKKPNGKGMAISGIILGFLNIIVSIGLGISLVVGGNWTANWIDKTAKKAVGVANPSDYRIRDLACNTDSGSVTATGMIENRTSSPKNYVVVVHMKDLDTGREVDAEGIPVMDIPAGDAKDFSVMSSDLGTDVQRARCSVKEVRNFLN